MRSFFGLLLFFPYGVLFSDINVVSTPWTKSFLETATSFSVERISPHFRKKRPEGNFSKNQGLLHLVSAPYPEWQVDMLIAGASRKTGKIVGRVENEVLSDLRGSFLALSFVAEMTKSQKDRVKNPLFFEMASETFEVGVGCGKHIYVAKHAYTQLFSYVFLGAGLKALWTQVELGALQSFYNDHTVRCSYSRVASLKNGQRFRGYGTQKTFVDSVSLQYRYQIHGLELFATCSERWVSKIALRRAEVYQVGVTYPISF